MEVIVRLRDKRVVKKSHLIYHNAWKILKQNFGLSENDDYDNLVIVESSVSFIDEKDLLSDVIEFAELVEDVDRTLSLCVS